MSENKTNLTPEQALDLHRDLYRPDYRGYHHRAIICLGLDRWLDCAEKAVREGRDPARYFSMLIQKEWQVYNFEKKAHKDQVSE
jgi:hypothetical protein